ncbi:MAG TPA: hypothetical protein VH188_01200 [Chthoniobacterales bacterium]|jgi:hypothetical protein|nr:hypothetical protein [Chthoniobacterales bacterium]
MSPPALSEAEEQIIARERLRLLVIGFYVKGAVTAVFVSFLLFHFVFMLGFSFMPESAWNPPPKPATTSESFSVSPSPSPRPVNQGPPVVIFRIFAGVIGLIILLGWTFGGLTIYAGRCLQKRSHRLFIFVMAALNCPFIPWGTLLGIATFVVLQTPFARREFGLSPQGS